MHYSWNTIALSALALTCTAWRPGLLYGQQPEYVVSAAVNGISVFRVDASNGSLTPVPGSPFPAPSQPVRAVADPQGRFVYAALGSAGQVAGYTMDASTGALTPIPGSPFRAGTTTNQVAVHPSGKFLYAANENSQDIAIFTIDQSTGILTAIPGSPFKTGVSNFDITTDPAGHYAFVASNSAGAILVLSIDQVTGMLSSVPGSPYPGAGATVTVHPNGRFVYGADGAGGTVVGYSLDANSGKLTSVPGSPYTGQPYPHWVTVDPSGRFLYVANTHGHDLSGFSIDQTTGALTPLPSSPYPAGDAPVSVAVDPGGQFVYETNDVSIDVFAYSINAQTGALTSAGSPLPVGAFPDSVVVVRPSGGTAPVIVPDHGGNTGTVSVQIYGNGVSFQDGATVKLVGSGPDIIGSNTTVPNASVLTTTFDLTGAAPGVQKVVVTNPDDTSVTLPNAFSVEQGGQPQISLSIIGRSQIRIGQQQSYYVDIQNQGSVDAPIVIASLSSSGDAQTDLNLPSGSIITSKAKSILNAVPSQLSGMGLPQAVYVGRVSTKAHVTVPVSVLEPSQSCPSLNGSEHLVQGLDPCAVLDAASDLADEYLNVIYIRGLANLLPWVKAITPADKGGLGSCFNLADLSTKVSCLIYKLSDALLETTANGLEGVKNDICALKKLAGCPGNCTLPQSWTDLLGIIDKVRQAEEQLETLFSLNEIPVDQVNLLESQVALFEIQALALPPTLGFPPPSTPSSFPVDTSTSMQICGVASLDPNAISGPAGLRSSHYVSGSAPIAYLISSENSLAATAPAQRVTISDLFDTARFDPGTLTLGPIAFSGKVLTPPILPLASIGGFRSQVDLRPENDLLVDVQVTLDRIAGLLKWQFTSLDPSTGLPPADPLAGFLPPGAETSVEVATTPSSGLPTDSQLQNQASITFDLNNPIATNTWVNTVDNTSPTSQISGLKTAQSTSCFATKWSGQDVGVGIKTFTIYTSDNGGPYSPWLTNTTSTSATFTGQPGHTYSFYSEATDLVGNVEAAKTAAEATTTVAHDATCNGRPTIAGTITSKSLNGTTETLTLQLTNNGVGDAQNVSLSEIAFRTLAGMGDVTLAGPDVPLSLGSLAAGASTTITLTLTVPSTVREFSINETGTVLDQTSKNYQFSIGQTVFP